MKTRAYATMAQGKPLDIFEYEPKPLGPHDIEISITHCGICHSDIHLIDNDWGFSKYPMVPGHEIVGQVLSMGSLVQHLKKGDRVGVGWQRSSCLTCEWCVCGDENLCPENEATCIPNFGGFAHSIRVDSRFAFKIPENLDSAAVAPLLCGGITVYSPLRHWNITPDQRVGVLGMGGLGHLAVKFASAFGCEVTVLTHSPDKAIDAKKFGAHQAIDISNRQAMKKAWRSMDFIISTVHVNLDWKPYMDLLRPDGKLCFVGVPNGPLDLHLFALLDGRKSIVGSPIGGRSRIMEMLNFASRHRIGAEIEKAPLSAVNHAIERVRKAEARYRMVLEIK